MTTSPADQSDPVPADPATALLHRARTLIEPAHRAALDTLPAETRHLVGYHTGWWDIAGTPRPPTGKALRPALALACARAAGGHDDQAIPAAVAVELAHDFTLIHDDVIDADPIRRHQPSAWTVFGTAAAILAGDALLILALLQPDQPQAVARLTAALLELCHGQAADLAFPARKEVTLDECVAMAEGKTGALLGAACEFGALAAGTENCTAAHYREFGRRLGVAFQITDDLLDLWGDPATTGKPARSDLTARKKTLPVVAALTSGTTAGEHLKQLYRRAGPLDEHALALAADLIEAAGGRTVARAEADRQIQAAATALTAAQPDPTATVDLHLLTELITHRTH